MVLLAQSHRFRDFPAGSHDMFAVNTASVAQLLDYAASCGARCVVLASTGAIYEPFEGILDEQQRVSPQSYYAATKLAAELLLRPYADVFAGSALRLFFPYGKGQSDRLIPGLVARIREGKPIRLNGKGGGNRVTPTYVDDVVTVIIAALEERWNGVFNVASGEVVSIRTLSERIGQLLERDPAFEQCPELAAVDIVPSTTKLASIVDLSGFRGLDEGLALTLGG
jgi:nucleoside-diphosphate-sugar epimerase